MNEMNEMDEKTKFPIPFLVYQALQSSLLAEAKRLTKDIATTLNQPEGPLWKEIQKEMSSFYLIEQDEPTHEEFQCKAYHVRNEIWTLCRDPVCYGAAFCPAHFATRCEQPPADLPIWKRIEIDETRKGFLDETSNTVYDSETLEKIGIYSPKKKIIKIFQMS